MKQLAGKPFAIIGVNSDRDLDELKKTIEEENITWRSFQNEKGVDGAIAENWGIRGWPTIFILDEKGTIRWTGHGGPIDNVITELLGEMGHEVKLIHEEDSHDESVDEDKSGDGDKGDGNKGDGKSDKDVKDKNEKGDGGNR